MIAAHARGSIRHRRRHATRAKWAELVKRWAENGLTRSEFARREGLNAGTLSYWKWRLVRGRTAKRAGLDGFIIIDLVVALGSMNPRAPARYGFTGHVPVVPGCGRS